MVRGRLFCNELSTERLRALTTARVGWHCTQLTILNLQVRPRRELGLLVGLAQLDAAVLEANVDDEEEERALCTHEQPREVEGDGTPPVDQDLVRALGIDCQRRTKCMIVRKRRKLTERNDR